MRQAVFAVAAGFLGWTLDAFDFFLVVIAQSAIAKDFGVGGSEIQFSLTLTLMFRPVGAFIFGLLADRYGRRIPMMVNLISYSSASCRPIACGVSCPAFRTSAEI
jgi:MFS transporter, SHS family, lactate transporter